MIYIFGVAASILVQFIKQKTSSQWQTLFVLLGVALAAAGIYTWLLSAGYWESVAGVLVTAGAFYAFILQRFESKPPVS